MLSIIHNDHINMNQLLTLLTKKLELLKQDKKIDFRLTKDIITYLKNYSDKYHHPMEDFIYDYYLDHCHPPESVSTRLPQEHKMLKKVTIELDDLLSMILLDAIVPNEQCIEKLERFIDLQKAHMAYEEREILPLIEQSLSTADWDKIRGQWLRNEYNDPLFGEHISAQYQKLAAILKQLQTQTQERP